MSTTESISSRLPVAMDVDLVQYLLIRKNIPVLSVSLFCLLHRITIARPQDILLFHVARSDLIIIDDTSFTIEEIEQLRASLKQFKSKIVIITSQSTESQPYWGDLSDGFLVQTRETIDLFTCRLIETIEHEGLVCLDFADIRCLFSKMTKTEFYEGIGYGESRITQAIENAVGNQHFQPTTALLIIFGGIDAQLNEFELAMNNLEQRLPDTCCLSGAVRIRPECLNISSLRVSIFLNYENRIDQYAQ
ncbi:hypothetical protein [Vibrio rarus]|uniref:hypothetical protein n=1 Tax=Vibrio rarus TaxID=413403 RepID=UPI0021C2ADF7|nr:hypothetical protein [Vibrio rarus]